VDKCDWSNLPVIPKAVVGDSTPVRKLKPLEAFVHEAALVMDEIAAPIDDIHGKVVNTLWNGIDKATKPFRIFTAKIAVPLFVFVLLVFVFHAPPLLAFLAACGVSIMDCLRIAGVIGPKKLDKNGKPKDD
jgi:hypothetical protein